MKWIVLVACIIIQSCIGGLYAWTMFVPHLTRAHGLSMAESQIIFGTLIAFFTIAVALAGPNLDRWGKAKTTAVGGFLFGLGYAMASFSKGEFIPLLTSIGIISGIGTGLVYMCPLQTVMSRFPERKGLAAGVIMAAFGGGSVILSLHTEFMTSRGSDVLSIFRWVGITYGFLIVGLSGFLPGTRSMYGGKRVSLFRGVPAGLWKDSFFFALLIGMFCGTFAGLLVIGNLKPLALSFGIGSFQAAMAVGLFAAGNALGRIVWGWGADRAGRRIVSYSLLWMVASLALLAALPKGSTTIFLVITFLIGFGFGSCFVIYAALVADRYGLEKVANVYPFIFLTYGASGIFGPVLAGWLHDRTGSFDAAILSSLIVLCAGFWLCTFFIRRKTHEIFLESQAVSESEPIFHK
jgi:OFA family oxalate/formate antiporter-like MFS transporter